MDWHYNDRQIGFRQQKRDIDPDLHHVVRKAVHAQVVHRSKGRQQEARMHFFFQLWMVTTGIIVFFIKNTRPSKLTCVECIFSGPFPTPMLVKISQTEWEIRCG